MMIDLAAANKELASLGAEERVAWAYERFGERMISTTSGGDTSAITPDIIRKALGDRFRPKIIFCDTGYSTPETLEMMAKIAEDSDVVVYRPAMTPAEIEEAYPGW